MCLQSAKLSLDYDAESKTFVGYGWRCMSVTPQQKVWNKATYHNGGRPWKIKCNNNKHSYIPGFHIFLNREDAVAYGGRDDNYIVKVAFREVLAFGTQASGGKYKDCIIANEMKVIGPEKPQVVKKKKLARAR